MIINRNYRSGSQNTFDKLRDINTRGFDVQLQNTDVTWQA